MSADYERLPTFAKPTLYTLTLTPSLDDFTFQGLVEIHLEVVGETSELVLNGSELSVSAASVRTESGRTLAGTPRLDPHNEFIHITLPETLSPGPATLVVAFAGTINDKVVAYA